MNIDLLKINGFGKIKNKEINLNKNINIIYGKNEQGKTTMLKFISSMFYGASKNKNGKDISDFDRYKPWEGEEYSGKIIYTLDDKKQFEVFREFGKKNPKIYNENYEDISKNFNIDKNKGNEFFFEQTGVDENIFNSSTFIEQKEIILDSADRRNVVQKISNLISTGENNTSYKKTIDKLNKKYIEEIGTERTVGRPLNIVKNKIENITKKINEIKNNEENKNQINYQKNNINNEIINIENKNNLLNEIKKIKEKNNIIEEQINIKNKLIEENKNKINNIEKNNINNKKENKIKNKKLIILLFVSFILLFLNLIIKINYKIKIIISALILIGLIFNLILIIKNKNKINNQKINNEKNIINKIIKELEQDINNLLNKINTENKNAEKILLQKYKNNINEKLILELTNKNLEEIEKEVKTENEKYNNLKFQKYQIELQEKNITEQIEEKINLEEQLENLKNQEQEILKLGQAILLAKEILEKAYNKMKNNITPKFTENLLKNAKGVIGEKYKNIIFNEEEGLTIELENGSYKNAMLLSTGTIDQLYLALRLAVLQEISKESMPIILDETFAYFDDERLENILKYLDENFKENQIIIFTCSTREKELLKKNNIQYAYIEL